LTSPEIEAERQEAAQGGGDAAKKLKKGKES